MTEERRQSFRRCLGISKSGHDRGRVYVILEADPCTCQAADGIHARLDKPKRKNRKHIQLIRQVPEEVSSLLYEAKTDSDLVHLLRIYRRIKGSEERGRVDV